MADDIDSNFNLEFLRTFVLMEVLLEKLYFHINLIFFSPGGGSSWQSSESDMSSGGPSEVGSMTAIDDNRRGSRTTAGRHSGYRSSISRNNENHHEAGYSGELTPFAHYA
jgi:hypothetical protein